MPRTYIDDILDTEDEPDLELPARQDEPYKPTGYALRDFETPIDAEAALYALRMLQSDRIYRNIFERQSCVDRDVMVLLGITDAIRRGKDAVIRKPRAALARQRTRVEKTFSFTSGTLAPAIQKLGDALQLDDGERRLLRLGAVATRVQGFTDFFLNARAGKEAVADLIGRAVDLNGAAVRKALHPEHTLCGGGFFESSRPLTNEPNPLELNSTVCDALLAPDFEVEALLHHLVRRSLEPRLTLDDYPYVRDADLMRRYLACSATEHATGVNILLYGAPGTGKTEFVRALALALGFQLYEVPNEDDDGDAILGSKRFSAYAICQKILRGRDRQLILFDEIEDVFGSGERREWLMDVGWRDTRRISKSWTNERLETNSVPTVWVCNTTSAMDRAYLRRFDMVVEFRAPGPSATRRTATRYFQPGEISDSCINRLTTIEGLPPAQIERAARVVHALGTTDVARRDAETVRLIESSMRAMGAHHPTPGARLPTHYDPAFIHADHDLSALVNGLKYGTGARMCFYGPPGTGKTAFAHYLAQQLGQPLRVKRASDLLSPYVGMTEQLIADAFESAANEHAVLLIDEADSFLRDRTGAQKSWEVTQVNELLTQMEAFDGTFIASTNLVDTLDAASLRRFDFKVKFDCLTLSQSRALLARVATQEPADADRDARTLQRLARIEGLTPGDFANVLRQLRISGEPRTTLRLVELLEAEAAMKPQGRHHAIGFVN